MRPREAIKTEFLDVPDAVETANIQQPASGATQIAAIASCENEILLEVLLDIRELIHIMEEKTFAL